MHTSYEMEILVDVVTEYILWLYIVQVIKVIYCAKCIVESIANQLKEIEL